MNSASCKKVKAKRTGCYESVRDTSTTSHVVIPCDKDEIGANSTKLTGEKSASAINKQFSDSHDKTRTQDAKVRRKVQMWMKRNELYEAADESDDEKFQLEAIHKKIDLFQDSVSKNFNDLNNTLQSVLNEVGYLRNQIKRIEKREKSLDNKMAELLSRYSISGETSKFAYETLKIKSENGEKLQ